MGTVFVVVPKQLRDEFPVIQKTIILGIVSP